MLNLKEDDNDMALLMEMSSMQLSRFSCTQVYLCKAFKWLVTVLEGGVSLEKYQKLARMQLGRLFSFFHVSFTSVYVLYYLRMELDLVP